MKILPAIEFKIRSIFPNYESEIALIAFLEMTDPSAEREWILTRARVQAAIIMISGSDLTRFLETTESSQKDWRDTLVAAGLANSDWLQVVKDFGFDFPKSPENV